MSRAGQVGGQFTENIKTLFSFDANKSGGLGAPTDWIPFAGGSIIPVIAPASTRLAFALAPGAGAPAIGNNLILLPAFQNAPEPGRKYRVTIETVSMGGPGDLITIQMSDAITPFTPRNSMLIGAQVIGYPGAGVSQTTFTAATTLAGQRCRLAIVSTTVNANQQPAILSAKVEEWFPSQYYA